VPVCIGGDDSIPIPILRAYAERGSLIVLQVDAHLDFRDEVHGVREGYSSPMRRASEMDHVTRIVQVGMRGVGSARPADIEDARAAGNLLVTAGEVREGGVGWVLDQLPADASVFVSFDCDGLDPSVFPAVSAHAPGGLDYPAAFALLGGIGSLYFARRWPPASSWITTIVGWIVGFHAFPPMLIGVALMILPR